MDILKAIIIIVFVSIPVISNCAEFQRVNEDYSTGKIRYDINGVSISATSCGYLSKSVLQNLADDSVAGEFDWNKMSDSTFKNKMFSRECRRLKHEMYKLRTNNAH